MPHYKVLINSDQTGQITGFNTSTHNQNIYENTSSFLIQLNFNETCTHIAVSSKKVFENVLF